MGLLFGQIVTGLANASALFLVAAGLSLIFGVTRVVNFAHGSLYMLGAFTAASVAAAGYGLFAAALAAMAVAAIVGAIVELVALRPVYRAPELFQLVATFAVVLIVADAALSIWGPVDRLAPRPAGLDGAVQLFGERIPSYDLFLIAVGPLVLGALWLLLNRTRFGLTIRAAAEDREMASALGVDASRLYTGVFALGAALAGLGGALQTPREPASLLMDLGVIAEAFVVVVVGGMGSVFGAFAAAVLISVAGALTLLIAPELSLALPFLAMAAVLALRPNGLFGAAEAEAHPPPRDERPLRAPSPADQARVGLVVALAAAAPALGVGISYADATEIALLALFAASLHLMMGLGGMASFGHAAWFGLAAYAAALFATEAGLSMAPSTALAALVAGLAAALYGWLCVRRAGVYLAMLTLAGAQLLFSLATQWRSVTGGDDGILGVWPDRWASGRAEFYAVALIVAALGVLLLHRLAHAPAGLALRAARDAPDRAEALGLDVMRQRWAAFALSGLVAGLAGALYAYSKGAVFPTELEIPRSFDALLMVLLGGVQSLAGPILGAAVFTTLEHEIAKLAHWRAILGGLILALVILAPDGLAGLARRLRRAILLDDR